MRLFLVLVIAIAFSANDETVFGPEFTFTNDEILRQEPPANEGVIIESVEKGEEEWVKVKAAKTWMETIRKRCGACRIEEHPASVSGLRLPGFKVIYPDGWWFEVSDDISVLEITTKPSTRADIAALRSRIQNDVFDLAREAGVTPHQRLGGGHISIDLKRAFRDDPVALYNFIADFSNHPELAMGILGGSEKNSPPLARLSGGSLQAFKKIPEKLKSGEISTVEKLIKYMNNKVYEASAKFQAISLGSEGRLEVRSIYPQINQAQYEAQVNLLHERIQYLKRFKDPIEYAAPEVRPFSPRSLSLRFAKYLEEMSVRWEDYEKVLPLALRKHRPSSLVMNRFSESISCRADFRRIATSP